MTSCNDKGIGRKFIGNLSAVIEKFALAKKENWNFKF